MNVFSTHDYDIGRSDRLSHRISLSSSTPLYTKQFPYYIKPSSKNMSKIFSTKG
ncbi:Hypothetical protein FKW44_002801 [Caligus rogercresseyi]|uniref:Uncharacterized protein n=1 Tax=Caligus rogercresseyi TaxID=217165 RepID=A0A7T8KKQ4_CALRO|nr:Hypothetical protein FKW44_002801 [Caligus rogercresseyi]